MRFCSIQTATKAIGLTLAVLLWSGSSVRAQTTYSQTANAGDNVSISFTGNTGTSTTAGSFNVTPGIGTAFCIDLWHSETHGSFSANTVTGSFASVITSEFKASSYYNSLFPSLTPVPTNVGDPTLTKELTYLGYISQHATSKDQVAAVQLAIWNLIDSNFKVTNFNSGTNVNLSADYTNINTLLGGGTVSSGFGSGLVAYKSSDTITGTAEILQINNQGNSSDQNLLTWGTINVTADAPSAPEPSTLAIAGLGALGFIGYGLRRRKAQGA